MIDGLIWQLKKKVVGTWRVRNWNFTINELGPKSYLGGIMSLWSELEPWNDLEPYGRTMSYGDPYERNWRVLGESTERLVRKWHFIGVPDILAYDQDVAMVLKHLVQKIQPLVSDLLM